LRGLRYASVVLAILLAWFAPLVALAQTAVDERLAIVKKLYASASYEEALSNLSTFNGSSPVHEVELYRALCLLALDRPVEVEQSLTRLVAAAPTYRLSDADVSPRLIAMFAEVRGRVLPDVARQMYLTAKGRFDGRDYEQAVRLLRQLVPLLADPAMGTSKDAADLRLLADGFLRLAEAEVRESAGRSPDRVSAPVQTPIATSTLPEIPRGAADPDARVYSEADVNVKAPIELSRRMPLWTPPQGFKGEFRGVLELIIDEAGNVVSAISRGETMPNYDQTIRAEAMLWKYRPAMLRDGTPVRYRKLVGYLLKPVS
jgi:hypothetical protein